MNKNKINITSNKHHHRPPLLLDERTMADWPEERKEKKKRRCQNRKKGSCRTVGMLRRQARIHDVLEEDGSRSFSKNKNSMEPETGRGACCTWNFLHLRVRRFVNARTRACTPCSFCSTRTGSMNFYPASTNRASCFFGENEREIVTFRRTISNTIHDLSRRFSDRTDRFFNFELVSGKWNATR